MRIRIFYDDDSSIVAEVGEGEGDENITTEQEGESEVSSMAESAVDSSDSDDSSVGDDSDSSDVVDVSYVIEWPDSDRPFMDTALDDYNVTEGLLLLLVVIALIGVVVSAFRGR